jgi:D-3-phosphoglycerate dehydrogenase / 2-oxoglutarate reductase
MFTIQKLDKISSKGLDLLSTERYETATEISNPDAILVRSFKMLDMEFQKKLKAIARAGAGVNNIPIEKCSEKGIVVFNTPGANANGVKELVIASLFLSSRKINKGIAWCQTIKGKGDEVAKLVEKEKSQFEGPEIKGKKLGIIGLGAIGVMVANDAIALGMDVIGYDPFISIDNAWGLSSNVVKALSLDQLISTSDYITIHVPLDNKTKGMFNKDKFSLMKKGVRIINLARGGLIVNQDIIDAIDSGVVACYVTDFPEDELLGNDNIITIPHLGASTPESEENCAIMAAKQLREFLEKGTIKNSVNFPECELVSTGNTRLLVAHENIPNMVGQITTVLADNKINISDMLNRHKGNIGYTVIDIEASISEEIIEKISSIKDIKMVRVIEEC